MKKQIYTCLLASLFAASAWAQEGTLYYSSTLGDQSTYIEFGSKRAEAYDVAMFVQDSSLVGMQVMGLRVAVVDCSATSYAGWLSSQLGITTRDGVKRADADIIWQDAASVADGYMTVTFDEPYTIGSEGFYAGYSFIVNELSVDLDKTPMYAATALSDNGFWIHGSRTFRSWRDMSDDYSTVIELVLGGDQVHECAAVIQPASDYYVKRGNEVTLDVTVVNHGTQPVSSVAYAAAVAGATHGGTLTLDEPIAAEYYGRSAQATLTLPAIEQSGVYDLTLNTTHANGMSNQDVNPLRTTDLHVLELVPVKRPIIEEYTGTWCGWCVRGLVAMEELADIYGDDLVGVAYHNSDPMEVMTSSSYPSKVSGFPGAWVDRVHSVDPYYGYTEAPMGIMDVIDYQATLLPEAGIDLKAVWNDDRSTITVTSDVMFIDTYDGIDYRVGYMLLEDDMYGEAGSDWDQSNSYASYAGRYDSDPFLKPLTEMSNPIEGYHFNDVVVYASGNLEGSLPADIEGNTVYSHSITINPDELTNTSGDPIVQNKDKLRVAAVVVNAGTGEVVNAARAAIGSTGVTEANASDKQVQQVLYYNLQGQLISQPTAGLYIKCTRYTDGSQTAVKVIK